MTHTALTPSGVNVLGRNKINYIKSTDSKLIFHARSQISLQLHFVTFRSEKVVIV